MPINWHICTVTAMATQVQDEPRVDGQIARRVRVLLASMGMTHGELAEVLGTSRPSASRSLAAQREWSANDVARLAAHFEVEVGVFFASDSEFLAAWGERFRGLIEEGGSFSQVALDAMMAACRVSPYE